MRTRNILPAVIIFGSISLVVLAVLLIRGVQQPQNPAPGRAEEGWQHFEDTDSKFSYMDDSNCWKIVTSGSASYHQADHKNPTHPQCGPVVNQWAKFDTTGSGIAFDKFRIGYAPWTYGALINISADGTRINQLNTNNPNIAGKDRKTKIWESSTLPCGEHELELRLDPKQRSGADTIDLDFVEVHTCTPSSSTSSCTVDSDCPSGQSCVSGTCRSLSQTHLACGQDSQTCVRVAGAGDNTDGCTALGASCSSRDNSPAVAEEGGKCQDNPNASARCFDCKKDSEGDQVNILDFSCFAKWYGQDVGKP